MRILVLGAGAIGGYFGGRLLEAGADVTFLVRPRRAAQLASDGLVVESTHGNIKRPVRHVTDLASPSAYDAVLLACKAYDLDDAVNAVRPGIAKSTAVLPLLNGVGHLSSLDETFGGASVVAGVCHISATVTAQGTIQHLDGAHALTIGARNPPQQEMVERLAKEFGRGRFSFKVSDDINRALWSKYAFLTTLAGMTCLMRAAVGDIAATRFGKSLTQELLSSTAEVAARSGYSLAPAWFEQSLALLTRDGSPFSASMLRDIERGGKIEAEHIVGDMLRRAETLGVAHDLLQVVYTQLKAYENRRDRERSEQ
jgi:2-dehydropantoate 2-reductase